MSARSNDKVLKSKDTGLEVSKAVTPAKDDSHGSSPKTFKQSFNPASPGTFTPSRFHYDFSQMKLQTNDKMPMPSSEQTGLMIQRSPLDGSDSCPTCPEVEASQSPNGSEPIAETTQASTSAEPTTEESPEAEETATPEETPATVLIVDDSAEELAPGQMRKSEFLARLRIEVCRAVDEALAGTDRDTEGCPYLDYWFDFYEHQNSAHIERSIHRYAPEAARVTNASEYISFITQRACQAAETWASTGQITGVPEGIPLNLPGESPSQNGEQASSSSGTVMAKTRNGGPRPAHNPKAVQKELGEGQPLEGRVKSRMESAFGMDFSHVRAHTDTKAADLAGDLNARAFTVGEHVAFGPGEYNPGTVAGDALIAHEMAHVVQQDGSGETVALMAGDDTRYTSLEDDADKLAQGAISSIWDVPREIFGKIANKTMSGIKSGMRLQRCTRSTSGPFDQTRLAAARQNFRSNNNHLTPAQWTKIDNGLSRAMSNNLNLWISFYDYYSNQDIREASPRELGQWRANELARTNPSSDTIVRPSVLSQTFPDTRLGVLLIHEYTHTRHDTNIMGSRDYQEGDSYAIEYFFAGRVNDTTRQGEILIIMSNPDTLTAPSGIPALISHFKVSYATMVGLYEIIDTGRSTRTGSPFVTPQSLTSNEARALATELVSSRADRHSPRLQSITQWVSRNLSRFTLPI